tara:strand:+ start:25980 stop:26903 length:924 start_codon:yes stop_codon:yes gene_type:complete
MDGLSGAGKRLLGSLLAGIPKIDQYVLSHYMDQTVSLFASGKIDFETAVYLLRTNHNLMYYDNAILRHANFRKSDLTSVTKHPRYKYIKQRMMPNDTKIYQKFKNKIVMQYCTHFTSNFCEPYFAAFKRQLIFIKLVRSPTNLEMINKLAFWSIKWEQPKCRDGYIKFYDKKYKKNYPHFMKSKLYEYLKANKYERAILMMGWMYQKKQLNNFTNEKKYGSKIIVLPFENLASEPKKYMKLISKNIGSKLDKTFLSTFKEQRVPRAINLKSDEKNTLKFLKNKIQKKYFLKLVKLNEFYKRDVLKKF